MGPPTVTSGPSTLGWRIVGKILDLYFESCDILRQHLLKKFITNLRKRKKGHSRTWLSNVHSETQKLQRQNANVLRSRSVHVQIADTCTHCVPIFLLAAHSKNLTNIKSFKFTFCQNCRSSIFFKVDFVRNQRGSSYKQQPCGQKEEDIEKIYRRSSWKSQERSVVSYEGGVVVSC